MKIGKALQGSTRLAFDAVEGVTDIVEGMFRNISAFSLPLGQEPKGGAQGIAGLVFELIRQSNGQIRGGVDQALARLAPWIDRFEAELVPGPNREAALAALNGVCGDHLEATGNPLACSMAFRRAGVEVPLESGALAGALPGATGKLLVAVHGLAMSDLFFSYRGHNHVEMLARDGGYTPVYLLYNSGRHVSSNGRELARKLQSLVDAWPKPIESLTLLGFSMGGLLLRSALHYAGEAGLDWPRRIGRAVYLGTPHHGSLIERGGNWVHATIGVSPYTAPLSALARVRSQGITDLRYGNLLDEDWQETPQFDRLGDLAAKRAGDPRRPVPLPKGIEHYAIGATLSKQPGEAIGKLLGDGLVHPGSATGRHRDPERCLAFEADKQRILYDQGHLSLLDSQEVSVALREWLL